MKCATWFDDWHDRIAAPTVDGIVRVRHRFEAESIKIRPQTHYGTRQGR
jgi:hypothetical protein